MKDKYSDKMKRWTVLVIVAFTMMMGYVFWDVVSPLSTTLKAPLSEGGMAWTAAEYGFYAGSYSIFNIFLLMLFFGGIILDKAGIPLTGILATGLMLGGAFVNYYAVTHITPTTYLNMPITFFGLIPAHLKTQVLIAAIGFGLFGVGCDITGITVSKIVTQWFTGHELASAMGIQVAMARLGTAGAISISPVIAKTYGISAPLLVGTLLLLAGFIMFLIYLLIYKNSKNGNLSESQSFNSPEESFSFRDFIIILKNKGFWLIAFLCVFFYTSIRPFLKFATDLLVNKYGLDPVTAGWIVSLLPYGTIILTPFFGSVYDRVGRGATLMLAGCAIVTVCHFFLSLPIINSTWVATSVMIFLGVAFSLVPSALWPSVPKLVPLRQLGTAYSIIYFVQNIGLMLAPMLIGNVIDSYTSTSGEIDFTVPMGIFTLFGLTATITALILLYADKHEKYGLEYANIKNNS